MLIGHYAPALVLERVAPTVVHVDDLPLAPGGPKVGLELWRWMPLALALETSLVVLSLALLPRLRRAWLLWASMPTVTVLSFFVPTPSSPQAMALTGLATYVLYAALARSAEVSTVSADR